MAIKCPRCSCEYSYVINSRPDKENTIRRRRMCENCEERFNTFEYAEDQAMATLYPIIKKRLLVNILQAVDDTFGVKGEK